MVRGLLNLRYTHFTMNKNKKKKKNKIVTRHPLADLFARRDEIERDLKALKPYEDYPEVRDNRQSLRNERADVEATIVALGGTL